MQKVLTLQFSCTGIGDSGRNSGQSLARRSSKRVAMEGERERGALEPPALHFDDLQF